MLASLCTLRAEMKNRFSTVLAAGLALSFASSLGCSSRTTAATQTTPVAFMPERSDAEAVALIDEMIVKLGGAAGWEAVKQIRFDMKYMRDGKMAGWFKHSWDRWNGRHRYEIIDMATVATAEKEGNQGMIKALVVGYDLFNRSKGFAQYGGQPADSSEKKKRIAEAYKRWQDDSYKLSFVHKLKDPGVVLKSSAKVKDQSGVCSPGCDVVEVTFSDGVGTDTYYLNINETTKMPEVWQKAVTGPQGEGRLGYKLEGWTTVGGLQFPTKLQNLGIEGEVFIFEAIEIGSPDDSLYIPRIL